MNIGDICTRNVVTCHRGTTAWEVACMMRNAHIGDVVVVDEPNGERIPVGIVTDRDLVIEVMAQELDPATVTMGDIMAPTLVTAAAADTVNDTIELMRAKGVRRVPVVDEHGGMVGIVTMDDMLKVLGDALTQLGRIIARETFQEQEQRP